MVGRRSGIAGTARIACALCAIVVATPTAPAAAALTAPQVTAACPPTLPGGGYCGDGGPWREARMSAPADVAVTADGFLVADSANSVVRRVVDGRISTVAGIGLPGDAPPSRPTSVAEVALSDPRGVVALPDGAFAVADRGLRAVLLVGADGLVRTLADRRVLVEPADVAALDASTLLVADAGAGRLLAIGVDGTLRTLGRGLARPSHVAVDPASGEIYVSQQRPGANGNVVAIGPDRTRRVVAGPGARGSDGELRFARVAGVGLRGDVLVVADSAAVRAFYPDGTRRIVAPDDAGDAGPARAEGIALRDDGTLLVADSGLDTVHVAAPVPVTPARRPLFTGPRPQAQRAVAGGGGASPSPPASGSCLEKNLPRDVKALQVLRNRKLRVKFPPRGWVGVFLAREGRRGEQPIARRYFGAARPNRTFDVPTKGMRGRFLVRVRAMGACRQVRLSI